ncbi:MAG TPA: polysaccharide biosynthesis tyrosine autokinase [Micropepsaceae bacterium]|nr:polysaccharide biosynthesis tyrosine autokinase [Micropepsaceae bacterium]
MQQEVPPNLKNLDLEEPQAAPGRPHPGAAIIDLKLVIAAVMRRWRIIAGIVVLGALIAGVVTAQMKPRYTATALLMVSMQTIKLQDIDSVLSGQPASAAAVESQIELLRSRDLARRVVEKLNLIEDPEYNGALGGGFSLDPRVWISSLFSSDAELPPEAKRAAAVEGAIDVLIDNLYIVRTGNSLAMTLYFVASDPQKAADIANAIAQAYVEWQLDIKFDSTRRATEWLNSRLNDLREQMRTAEAAMEAYRSEQGLSETRSGTLAEGQLDELNTQLALTRASLAEAEAKYARVRQLVASGAGIDSMADVLDSETISALRAQQAELVREKADLETRYGPRHPKLVNIQAQLTDIESQIRAEIERISASLGNEVTVIRAREASLRASIADLTGENNLDNAARVRLRELERDAETARQLYETFLTRFKEVSNQEELQEPDTRIVSSAQPPTEKSGPRIMRSMLAVAGISLLLGLGVVFLLERLDTGIRTSAEIERILGLPVSASIPLIDPAQLKTADGKVMPPQDYVVARQFSAYAESLRTLRTSLSFSSSRQQVKVVAVTSTLPNEGKTTTAISLARSAALSGQRVLLVDCDLRRPSVHTGLAMTPKAGIVELLLGEAGEADAVMQDPLTPMRVIGVVAKTKNTSDILASKQFENFIFQARREYDLVILDTAPVLPVVDTRVLAKIVDRVVYLVQWDRAPRDAVASGARMISDVNPSVLSIVFSRMDLARQAQYGYGDAYYYYSRYNKYYAN